MALDKKKLLQQAINNTSGSYSISKVASEYLPGEVGMSYSSVHPPENPASCRKCTFTLLLVFNKIVMEITICGVYCDFSMAKL